MVVHHLIVASMARVRPLASCGLGYGARAWHERRRERAIPPTEAAITSWDSWFDVPLSTLDEFDEPFPSSFVKGSATTISWTVCQDSVKVAVPAGRSKMARASSRSARLYWKGP